VDGAQNPVGTAVDKSYAKRFTNVPSAISHSWEVAEKLLNLSFRGRGLPEESAFSRLFEEGRFAD
jgi:hypothetical protein